MRLLRKVRGQNRAELLLGSALSSERLAHAYLFAGPDGVGKLTAALELAAAIVCTETEGYCGECRNCRRIFDFDHPDVRITIPSRRSVSEEEVAEIFRQRVEDGKTPLRVPGNTYIGIDQIRELEKRLSLKAFEASWHVEILLDCHRLRTEAANALLKTLEEPPDNTLLVLTTTSVSSLLPTIRSRAHLIRFNRLPRELVREELQKRMEMQGERLERIVAASDGSVGRALRLAEEGSGHRAAALDTARALGKCGSAVEVLELVKSLVRELGKSGCLEFAGELRSLVHDQRRLLMGAEPLSFSRSDRMEWDVADDSLEEIERLLLVCERRIWRNVSPGLAISVPMVSMWKAIYREPVSVGNER